MSTPARKSKKRHSSINAPFKSPLKKINESSSFTDPDVNNRNNETNKQVRVIGSQSSFHNADEQTSPFQTELHPEKENIPIARVSIGDISDNEDGDDLDDNNEIEKCVDELLSKRPNQSCIDLEVELAQCRNRLHAYNEAKDSCIILFGLLANNRGCLVRDLYSEYGLDLDD
ncbi:unnamed protein product [Schistosoma turkestanicum]|nr:unnamed protein product [Schistosoma turkestanicum]